jgi:hypothetical protein
LMASFMPPKAARAASAGFPGSGNWLKIHSPVPKIAKSKVAVKI